VLARAPGQAQAIDGAAGGGGHQPGFGVLDVLLVGAMPAQPDILHHVLGLVRGAEHAVGHAEQARA